MICKACEAHHGENGNHNDYYFYPKLHVKCPNILASMYAQRRLKEEFGYQILGKDPHYTDKFVIVGPPRGEMYKDEKSLIVSGEDSEHEDWTDLLDALGLIVLIEKMKNSLPPKK